MDKISWIKELAKADQQMEKSVLVDVSYGISHHRLLMQETLRFMNELKADFADSFGAFNEMKESPLGRVKIYGISKTHSDFMLFRNGFKMVFAVKTPGQISIRFNYIGTNYVPGPNPGVGAADHPNAGTQIIEEEFVEAQWGAFGELIWTYQEKPLKREFMVRHYMSLFLHESSK